LTPTADPSIPRVRNLDRISRPLRVSRSHPRPQSAHPRSERRRTLPPRPTRDTLRPGHRPPHHHQANCRTPPRRRRTPCRVATKRPHHATRDAALARRPGNTLEARLIARPKCQPSVGADRDVGHWTVYEARWAGESVPAPLSGVYEGEMAYEG